MAETDEQFLARLEAQSRAKQLAFVDGIAGRLKRPRVTEKPDHPYRGAPDFWNGFEWSPDERIERFTANFADAGGHVVRLSDLNAVGAFVREKAEELSAASLVRQDEPELEAIGLDGEIGGARVSVWNREPDEDWEACAAEADIGVVMADYAVAYTGSVAVLSSKRKGRSVSLLPTVLVVVLPVDRLYTRLGEVLERFDRNGRAALPAGIHFISGPSRSADIENDLTIGVHGPGIVYVLLVGG